MNPVDLEVVADQFEAGWAKRSRQEIEDILQSNRANTALLIELVHADLELSLKSGDAARVEIYLDKFPELKQNITALESLIKTEFWIRERLEPDLNFSEFVLRFPENYLCLVDQSVVTEVASDVEDVIPDCQVDRSYVSTRFSMEKIHAEGGLGNVWLAHDHELDRKVALKEIKNKHATNPRYQSRFVQEALITGTLDHPGVAPVFSLGHFRDGRPYYAMRLVHGKSLRTKITEFHQAHSVEQRGIKRNLEFRRLLQSLLDACYTIEYAHSKGIIHRDIKPGNIMIGQYGETLVVDWGLARYQSDEQEEMTPREQTSSTDTVTMRLRRETTAEGQAIGSPAFMSPEQAIGNTASIGFASDVYGLGASLYNIVTGQTRPESHDDKDLHQLVNVALELRPLISIASVAMSYDPTDRFKSPKDFAENIERFLANEPIECHNETFLEKLERQTRRHSNLVRTVAIAAVVVAVLAVSSAIWINAEQQKTAKALADVSSARMGEQKAKETAIAALEKEQKAKEAAIRFKSNIEKLGRELLDTLFQSGPMNRGLPASISRQLDILRKELLDESPQLEIQRLLVLGQYEQSLGNLSEAVDSFERALRILVASRSFDSSEYAEVNLNLASAYYEQGQVDNAESCLEVVFNDSFASKEFANVRVGALSLSAEIERDKSNLEFAKKQARQALELAIATFGKDDFHTQIVTDQLAGIYSLLNDNETALVMFEALIEQQLELGFQNTRVGLTARRNYGVVLLEENRIREAVETMEAVVADRGRIFDGQELETLDAKMMLGHAKYHLARLNRVRGGREFDAAVKLIETAYEQHVEHFGIEHPQTGKNALYLIEAWRGAARFKKSTFEEEQDRIKKAAAIADQLREHHGKFFVTCNRVDNQVSRYFELFGKLPQAMEYSQKAAEGIVGRYKETDSLTQIDSRDAAILSGHAKRNFKIGDHEEVVFWLSRIAENEERLYVLTLSLIQLNEHEKAASAYWKLESASRSPQRLLNVLLFDLDFFEALVEKDSEQKGMKRTLELVEKFRQSENFLGMDEKDRERLQSILDR